MIYNVNQNACSFTPKIFMFNFDVTWMYTVFNKNNLYKKSNLMEFRNLEKAICFCAIIN